MDHLPLYLNIRTGSKARLASLKRDAEKLNSNPHNLRKSQGDETPYTWKDVRYSGFNDWRSSCCDLSKGFNGDAPIWYTHTGPAFSRELFADEVATGISHTGWFSDSDGFSTIRGIVVSLPHERFLIGYYQSVNDERVYLGDVYACKIEAAYAADSEAERIASIEREHDYQYQQAIQLENDIDEKETRLLECLALRNKGCFKHLREEAKALIADIRDMRNTLKTDFVNIL